MLGNRSVIRPKQTLARAGGGCEAFKQKGVLGFFLLVVIHYCSVFVIAEVTLNPERMKEIQMRGELSTLTPLLLPSSSEY